MDHVARRTVQERVRELLEPTVTEAGYDLIAVEMTGDQSGPILRLTIDRAGGVDVSDCARVTRSVSPELDVADPVPGAYRLEVSSPGIERPVERLSDFRRFVGYGFKLRMIPGTGRKRYTGRLVAMQGDLLTLHVDGADHSIPLADIDRAHLDLTTEEFLRFGEEGLPEVEGEQP
jgi:ribosome maturation factor RimP